MTDPIDPRAMELADDFDVCNCIQRNLPDEEHERGCETLRVVGLITTYGNERAEKAEKVIAAFAHVVEVWAQSGATTDPIFDEVSPALAAADLLAAVKLGEGWRCCRDDLPSKAILRDVLANNSRIREELEQAEAERDALRAIIAAFYCGNCDTTIGEPGEGCDECGLARDALSPPTPQEPTDG